MDQRALGGAALIAGACVMLAVLLCGDAPYSVFTVLIPLGFLGCAAVVLHPLITLDVRAWLEGVVAGFALPVFCLVPVRLVAGTDRVQTIVTGEIVAIAALSFAALLARIRLGRRPLAFPDLIPQLCPGASRWETDGVQWAIRGGGDAASKGGVKLWIVLQSAVAAPRDVGIRLEDFAGEWDERGTVAWAKPERVSLGAGGAVELEIALVPGETPAPKSQVYVRVGAAGEAASRTMGDAGREPPPRMTALRVGAAVLSGDLDVEDAPNVTFINAGRRVASGPPPAVRVRVLRAGVAEEEEAEEDGAADDDESDLAPSPLARSVVHREIQAQMRPGFPRLPRQRSHRP